MNREQKAQRYDWLLNQYKGIERQINNVEKLPLEETLQDINSTEHTPGNLAKVNHLKNQLRQIDEEVKRLY